MNPKRLFAAAMLAALCVWPLQARKRHILMIIETKGFHHQVTDHAGDVVKQMGQTSGKFDADVTADSESVINAANLKKYDAVLFFTTGNLPWTDQQKADFMSWLKAGHGFVGVHCATDTFYNWPEYGQMIGGYFNDHPWHAGTTETVINLDPKFPSQRQWPKEFQWTDEWYQFKDWDPSTLHVLMKLDADKLDLTKPGVHRTDKYFANAWVKYWGKGRVFYTALGHDANSWDNPQFQQHLLNGIRWADGDIKYKVKVP
jgi:type 1 glutamine amidotransferase